MMYSCNDSNDLFHTFLTLTCPSAYYNYVVSQYSNILQYFGCNVLIWQNTISSQLYCMYSVSYGVVLCWPSCFSQVPDHLPSPVLALPRVLFVCASAVCVCVHVCVCVYMYVCACVCVCVYTSHADTPAPPSHAPGLPCWGRQVSTQSVNDKHNESHTNTILSSTYCDRWTECTQHIPLWSLKLSSDKILSLLTDDHHLLIAWPCNSRYQWK